MNEGIDRGPVAKFYWIVGGLVALALSGIAAAIFLPGASGEALPVIVSITALAAGVGASYHGVLLRRRAEKVSGEMNALSARLLRIESRLAEPAPNAPGLTSTVAEVTGEIALLGGIVRDLAVTVATQDRDVASLKDQVERAKAQAPVPVPSAPLVPKAAPAVAVPAAVSASASIPCRGVVMPPCPSRRR